MECTLLEFHLKEMLVSQHHIIIQIVVEINRVAPPPSDSEIFIPSALLAPNNCSEVK
jgi:hypothetical protein